MKRVTYSVGLCLLLSFALGACGRSTSRSVPLPALDAPRESIAVGEPGEYRLQPGDLVRIKFLYHPELDVKVPIRPDGAITLQLGGEFRAAGLTTTELEQVIKTRTSDRLRDPEVTVLVAQLSEQKVYVGGQVRIPGFVLYRPGMSPLQAIMDRGGFTDTARLDSVLRVSGSQNDYQGTRLDFTKPLGEGAPENVQLAAGDVLFVPSTFIGDVNTFVRLYIRGVLPVEPRIGAGTTF
jgi:protein involved in polysaccharide export with SLBB domain